MESLYALIPQEKLSAMLASLSTALGLPVQLLNAEGAPLEHFGEAAPYCMLLKKQVFLQDECRQLQVKAGRIAYTLGESYIFTCHAELNNIAFSLVSHQLLLGTIIVGPLLMDTPDSSLLSAFAEERHLSPTLCLDLFDELRTLPVISPKQVKAISDIMSHLFSPLLEDERLLMQQRQGKIYQQSRINEIVQRYKGTESDTAGQFIYQKEKELLHRVKLCDMQGAKAVLNELLGYTLCVVGESQDTIRARALELTILLSRVAMEGGAPVERILSVNPLFLSQLQSAQSFEDLCYTMQEVVEDFIQAITQPAVSQESSRIRDAVSYIARSFDQPLSLQSMAQQLNISPSYFSTLFAKQMGMGYHEYLTRIRVEEGRRLLTATDYPISQIAITVGYADQSSFTKAFRRIYGITPLQVR